MTFVAVFASRTFLRHFVVGARPRSAPVRATAPAELSDRFDEIAASRARVLAAVEPLICQRRTDDCERGLRLRLQIPFIGFITRAATQSLTLS